MANKKLERHVLPLHVNGMNGRMLRMPAPPRKKRQILLLYGHHASLERMFGLAEVMGRYGAVTMPDLPGFGGMDSFYKIGQKPTIDNYADYLASLIKLYYKRRRVTIFAMSFSVPLVVRTLQKYPDLAKRVDMFVSVAGFVHRDDFTFDKKTLWSLKAIAGIYSHSLPAYFAKKVFLTRPVITATYNLVSGRHSKMKDAIDRAERDRRIDFEVGLWRMNDVRTRANTMTMMFTMDLCKTGKTIKVPAYHIATAEDRYFDNEVVKQHMHIIFDKFEVIPSKMTGHAPTIVATAKEAAPYVPPRLKRMLS
jgi:pimeloyl-ACP methyl ester carboxylesterase